MDNSYIVDNYNYFVFELLYDNNYGTIWKVEEDKDIFRDYNSLELRKNTMKFLKENDVLFKSIDMLNDNKVIKFIKKGINEYIYGTNSKKLNKNLLDLKMRIAPSTIVL